LDVRPFFLFSDSSKDLFRSRRPNRRWNISFKTLMSFPPALKKKKGSKRGNSLRVMFEAVHWGRRGAGVNTISPGIIITPLAKDELSGPRGPGYRRMIEDCSAKRAGTPDEVGTVGALLMGRDGAFITGSDFLMDGGVTAAYRFGDRAPK
jgi:NAD(P)-dependent dehydrogenase (short-subunit alcohol dehydrogenase family)